MSYCHECGEQVAKEDVFCPFCGITLKPVVAVNDSSMSETVVDVPLPVINQAALDALTAKEKPETPVIEALSEPEIEKSEHSESTEFSEMAAKVSPNNTSENWTMKTDSVEIPAEFMAESQGIPLPPVFAAEEPPPKAETAPAEIKIEEIKPAEIKIEVVETPKLEELPISEPIAENKEAAILADAPTPLIIQNQDFEFKDFEFKDLELTPEPLSPIVENEIEVAQIEDEILVEDNQKVVDSVSIDKPELTETMAQNEPLEAETEISEPESFEPVKSAPIVEAIELPQPIIELPIVEEKFVDYGMDSLPSPINIADESFSAEISQPISVEPENIFVQEPKEIIEEPKFDSPSVLAESSLPEETKFEEVAFSAVAETHQEPENNAVIKEKAQPEIFEPPIAMPDLPLVLENQDEQTKFDSVQIIQKDEIPAEKVEESPVKPEPLISQTVADEPVADKPKEARSFTTPNIGNADTDGRKAAKLKPIDEGVVLNGRYEIVRKIGGGGMGAVYLANDRNLGGVLRAVKEMVQSYIESDQQDKAISDFKRESMLLTSLDHPAIPTIYDYFYDEKEARFYLVMKYISGGDLSGRLRSAPEGRIDEKSVTEWSIQIADVLEYLHNHEPSIVYRDLKPANVMIDGNSGRVMLIDFGIARWVNKEEKGVTAVGTMGYAPPELFSGNVEPRSDIYSLGSTMFHLLTGADPQSNPLLIFDFQKNPRPRQINSQLSDQIERILMRSVEYNADLRFASAAQLRDELKEHLSNLQIGKVTYGVKAAPTSPTFSEQSVFCGFCGRQIVATDVFCAFCGAQQPIAQQSFSSPASAAPLAAKLVIIGTGELEPSSFRLEKTENLLGRRDPMSNIFPEVDLSKYDPQTKISRRHARIWRDGNNFLVEDLGSSNGTTLLPAVSDSFRLLPHQPHPLVSGDKIRLGDTTLHFNIG